MALKIIASIYRMESHIYTNKFPKMTNVELIEQYNDLMEFLTKFQQYEHKLKYEIEDNKKIDGFLDLYDYKRKYAEGCFLDDECEICRDNYNYYLEDLIDKLKDNEK